MDNQEFMANWVKAYLIACHKCICYIVNSFIIITKCHLFKCWLFYAFKLNFISLCFLSICAAAENVLIISAPVFRQSDSVFVIYCRLFFLFFFIIIWHLSTLSECLHKNHLALLMIDIKDNLNIILNPFWYLHL